MTDHEQVFVNAQKNLRQFIPYGAGSNFYGSSPWSLGSQAAFDLFKTTVQPETSWTYEVGVRTSRTVARPADLRPGAGRTTTTSNFSNRLFNIAPYNFINPGASILVNVGGVTTDGVDMAATLNFGSQLPRLRRGLVQQVDLRLELPEWHDPGRRGLDAVTVATGGKWVPLTPKWLNKTIASVNFGPFEAQVSGDYIGRRYVTYLNDLSVKSTFLVGLEASYRFETPSLT